MPLEVSARRARIASFLLCVAAVLLAVLASDVDPYVLRPIGVMLPLPGRRPLWLAQWLVPALAALSAVMARRAPRAGHAVALLLAALTVALLLFGTPFSRPCVHGLSALLTVALLSALLVQAFAQPGAPGRTADPAAQNGMVAGLAVAAVLLAGEAVATAVPASHAVGYTLASRL